MEHLRFCSYGGELARLGEPAGLGEISLHFAEIPPRRDENCPCEHVQVASSFPQSALFYFSDVN